MEIWVELQRAMDEKERMDEVQRAVRIAANEVIWAAARLRDVAEKDTADLVTTADMTEPVEQPSEIPSLSGTFKFNNVEDDAFLQNSNSSLSTHSESPTSMESPMMIHDTVGNR